MISLFSLMALQGKLEGLLVPETEVVFMPTLINGGIIYVSLFCILKYTYLFKIPYQTSSAAAYPKHRKQQ